MFEHFLQGPHHLARHRTGPYSKSVSLIFPSSLREGPRQKHPDTSGLPVAEHCAIPLDSIETVSRWRRSSCRRTIALFAASRNTPPSGVAVEPRTAFIFHASKWLRLSGDCTTH